MREELRRLAGPDRPVQEVMMDKGLAALGDALVNLAYSLALSLESGRPTGRKLDNKLLSGALRASGLRALAPRRMDRHELANAAEALIAYGWLKGLLGLWEVVEALMAPDVVEGLSGLLKDLSGRLPLTRASSSAS